MPPPGARTDRAAVSGDGFTERHAIDVRPVRRPRDRISEDQTRQKIGRTGGRTRRQRLCSGPTDDAGRWQAR